MKYTKEFKSLLTQKTNGYIGYGNPNAKILFIGQEPAIDRTIIQLTYEHEIANNTEQWCYIVENNIGYESVDHSKIDFGSPLHPWANQKYQVRSEMQNGEIRGIMGTSRTWYNYQKIVNKIFETFSNERKPMTKDDYLDFHRLSFHTDMSAVALKNHINTAEGLNSVIERMELLSSDFFHKFPIVIASVGHFPRDTYGNSFFGDVFGVEFLGNEDVRPNTWMNVSIRNLKSNPMLLIHTPQLSAAIRDKYIENIASSVVSFAKNKHIDLMPEK